MTEAARAWRKRNPERLKAIKQRTYRKNFRKYQSDHLKRKYGITLEQYEQLAIAQGYACAICNQPETAFDTRRNIVRNLSVDHCHKTGKVRGLLCGKCNSAIGKLKENPQLFSKAVAYLKEHL